MTTKMRVFASRDEADTYLAAHPPDAFFLERSEAEIASPGHAAERLRAKGVLTETPLKVLPLRDGTFAVPVPLQKATVREKDARGVDYDRTVKSDGNDALAVEKDQRADVKDAKAEAEAADAGDVRAEETKP